MTSNEIKQAFIHGTIGKGIMRCDENSVKEGLEKLDALIGIATTIETDNNTLIESLQNVNGFYGFVQGNCLSEDNLLYDLNMPSFSGEKSSDVINDLKEYTKNLKTLLSDLKRDIELTTSAIYAYNNRNSYTIAELGAAAESISLFNDYERLGQYIDSNSQVANIKTSSVIPTSRATTYKVSSQKVPLTDVSKNTITEENKEQLKSATQTISSTKKEENLSQKISNKQSESISEKGNTIESIVKQTTKTQNNMSTDFTKGNLSSENPKKSIDNKVKLGLGNVASGIVESLKDSTIKENQDKNNLTKLLTDTIKNKKSNLQSGSLVSSIGKSQLNNNDKLLKPIKIGEPKSQEKSVAGKFVPPIAGVSTAAVAGIGTKIYVEKKDENKEVDEEKNQEDNKFFNYNLENDEERETSTYSSKEDIINMLES